MSRFADCLTTLDVTSRHALITPRCYTPGRSDGYDELERRLTVRNDPQLGGPLGDISR